MKLIKKLLFLSMILAIFIQKINCYCAPWEETFLDDNKHCDQTCRSLNCAYGYCANDNSQREFACKCMGAGLKCNGGNQWLDGTLFG